MKLTAKNIFEAFPVIVALINQKRPMPQAGKFRLSRLHAKLQPEFAVISNHRDDLIKAYDHHPMVPVDPESPVSDLVESPNFSVPDDKMPEFSAAFEALCKEEIEVEVNPIPIDLLSPPDATNGSIEAVEITALGDLICEPA